MDTKDITREEAQAEAASQQAETREQTVAEERPVRREPPREKAQRPSGERRPRAGEAPAKRNRPGSEGEQKKRKRPEGDPRQSARGAEAGARRARPDGQQPKQRRPLTEEEARARRAAAERAQREAAEQAEQIQEGQQAEAVQTEETVWRPSEEEGRLRPVGGTRPQRPAGAKAERRPKKGKADAKKKKAAKPSDAQYHPYKQANKKKKAQRAGSVKKFFSKQNQVLTYFRNLGDKGDTFAEDSDIARQRKARREADAARKKKRASLINAPAVVYTEPIAFNRDRLIVQLISVVAVVLAFVLGLSVFFKVKTITVSGAEVYSTWSVLEASGIKEGDNLLTFGRARAAGQITANLPYVKSVRIGIKLPDTVNIEIDEESVTYAIKSAEGIWWLINSDGKVVEMANNQIANNHTQVLGVTIDAPTVNSPAVATEEVPTETTPDGEYVPITVTGYQRLNAALQILRALEDNDIVGDAASVDVSRMEDIIIWYGNRYQVNLGDATRLDYKVACMVDVILQMSDYQNGILDCSFTTWPDQVGFTPFQ